MAIAASRPRAHYERGLAHFNERRSPQAGVQPSTVVTSASSTVVLDNAAAATTSAASQQVFTAPPQSVKALAGVITILGLFILGEFGVFHVLRQIDSPINSRRILEDQSLETPQTKCRFSVRWFIQ